MRKLHWVLLLPLFLLFAQQGELRHEYSHHGRAPAHSQKKAPDGDRCTACLAYAQLAGTGTTDAVVPTFFTDLAFHHTKASEVADVVADAVSPRSRGPPAL